jgi:LacI family transcriptional regulator of maltose regulon
VGSELCERAAEKGVPLVFASRASYLDEADTLRPDNMQAAQMLTEHLIRRGHQRIAWLGGKSSSLTRAERVGGYCATLIKYGLPFHSEWVVECESSQKKAAEAIGALLRSSPTISAVICYNDVIAMGAWFGLIRAGRQSGEGGVETFFGHQVALGAFADVGENALTICRSSGLPPLRGRWATRWRTGSCSASTTRTFRPDTRLWRRGW